MSHGTQLPDLAIVKDFLRFDIHTSQPRLTADTTTDFTRTISEWLLAFHGLPPGTKASIGIGVALGVIVLLCLGFLFLLRRRKQRHSPHAAASPSAFQADSRVLHEMHQKEAPAHVNKQRPAELSSHEELRSVGI